MELQPSPRSSTSRPRLHVRGGRSIAVAAVVALAALGPGLVPAPVQAQAPACVAESEPNDAPETAVAIVAPGCLDGHPPGRRPGHLDVGRLRGRRGHALDRHPHRRRGLPHGAVPGAHHLRPRGDAGGGRRRRSWTSRPRRRTSIPVTRPDVLVPAGRYLVGLARTTAPDSAEPPDTAYSVTIEPGTPLPAPGEQEPNDDAEHATPVADAFALSADMGTSSDVYRWRVGADDASQAWSLDLASGLGVVAGLTLAAKDGTMLVSATADEAGRLAIPDLRLPRGEYLLSLTYPTEQPQVYTLSATAAPLGAADPEPNDDPAAAIDFDTSAGGVTGRLERAGDVDVYRLSVDATLAARQLDLRLLSRAPGHRPRAVSVGHGRQPAAVPPRGRAGLAAEPVPDPGRLRHLRDRRPRP